MSLKGLFKNVAVTKTVADKSAAEIGDVVESMRYHSADIINEKRYVPQVDFTRPRNFARYGSAEQYYIDSFAYIQDSYPYDGSLAEKLEWQNTGSYLDLHVFENEYPRTTGYIIFSADGYGTSTITDGYGLPDDLEYIYVRGGPNTGSTSPQTQGANLWQPSEKRANNLKLDLDEGATLEFWLKKDGFDTTKTHKEVLFDLWNYSGSGTSTEAGYGRLRFELTASGDDGAGTGGQDPFRLTLMSGGLGDNAGFATASVGPSTVTTSSVADGNWHHYALSVKNATDSKSIYFDGIDDAIKIGDAVDWDAIVGGAGAAANAFSISMWVYADGTATGTWASLLTFGQYASGTGFRSLRMGVSTGQLWFYSATGGSNFRNSADVLETNKWYHVVVTCAAGSGGATHIYINGSLSDSAFNASGARGTLTAKSVLLGNSNDYSTAPWAGYIDNLGIWDKQLSLIEVREMYNSGIPSDLDNHSAAANLVAWYPLGDATGDSLNSTNVSSAKNEIHDIVGLRRAYGVSGEMHLAQISPYSPANTGIISKFYIDGELRQSGHHGLNSSVSEQQNPTPRSLTGSMDEIAGSMVATIGALVAPTSGSAVSSFAGKLDASLDEFRYWKTQRTSRDIGRYWFTQVGGGTNTDVANTDLGVYYKFNEGITGQEATDKIVLDYSGRLSNGAWNGYTSNSRNTGSAIVSASAGPEFEDPILYTSNSLVAAKLAGLQATGSAYDNNNSAMLFSSFPSWMQLGDPENNNELKKLSQVISSYFDTLHLQIEAFGNIENPTYVSGSDKPNVLASRLLESRGILAPELFLDADILEQLGDRSEDLIYQKSLSDIKNTIYQNIYNNLINIFKTKGTKKSFRNMLRCFGVDDEIYRINMYSDKTVYELKDNRELNSVKKRYIDFNHRDNFKATVFLSASSVDATNTVSYLSSSAVWSGPYAGAQLISSGGFATTLESYVFFPRKPGPSDEDYNLYGFRELTASLFGRHTVNPGDPDALTWDPNDVANFQVFAIRDDILSNDAYFMLSSSAGWLTNPLTSSWYPDVYDNNNWGFAVTLKPDKYPYKNYISGSSIPDNYTVEFKGINMGADVELRSFNLSASITPAGQWDYGFMTGSTRVYVGAHRQNFTGDTLQSSDVRVGFCRYWLTDITPATLKDHIRDVHNYGTPNPSFSPFLYQVSSSNPGPGGTHGAPWLFVDYKEGDTLALNWDFETITSSNASGEFHVPDFSSGSTAAAASQFGLLGDLLGSQHPGYGYGFPVNATGAVNYNYVLASELSPPEVLNSDDMISILNDQDDEIFLRDSRPINYQFIIEKSMYRTISDSMLQMFASIEDFNNLIGDPVQKYRTRYKQLDFLKRKYFEKVQNEIDFDRYYEFYKWFDSSLSKILAQLMPVGTQFDDEIQNVIENHALERNKYEHKLPGWEPLGDEYLGQIVSILPLSPGWRYRHHPISNLQKDNFEYWKSLAERNEGLLATGDTYVDTDKQITFNATTKKILQAKLHSFYRFNTDRIDIFEPGVKFDERKNLAFVFPATQPFGPVVTTTSASQNILVSRGSSVEELQDIAAILDPLHTASLAFGLSAVNKTNYRQPKSGKMGAPFKLLNSSGSPASTSHRQLVSDSYSSDVILTNLHEDIAWPSHATRPLQGPFTEKHVGGRFYRHTALNDGEDDRSNRAEGWRIQFDGVLGSDNNPLTSPYLAIVPPNYPPEHAADGAFPEGYDSALPTAYRTRIEGTKSPANIKNIKTITGSLEIRVSGALYQSNLGTYSKSYEVLQSPGRTTNDPYFAQNAASFARYPETLATRGRFLLGSGSDEEPGSWNPGGTINYLLPTRPPEDSVFVTRYASPGGRSQKSLGFLDPRHAEISVYNAQPYRNQEVLNFGNTGSTENLIDASIQHVAVVVDHLDKNRGLRQLLSLPCGPGYSDGVYGYVTPEGVVNPSYHKVPRNRAAVIKKSTYSATGPFFTGSTFDNGYVQHAIPRSPQNYQWVSESCTADAVIFDWAYPACDYLTSSTWPLITISDAYSDASFVSLNNRVVDPVSTATNTIGNTAAHVEGTFRYINVATSPSWQHPQDSFNTLILGRDGPYQYPSWKQVRNTDNRLLKAQNKEHIITMVDRSAADIEHQAAGHQRARYRQLRLGNSWRSFKEPPISSESIPMVHRITQIISLPSIVAQPPTAARGLRISSRSKVVNYVFKHSYANKLTHFANYKLDNLLGLTKDFDSGGLYFNRLNSMIFDRDNKDIELRPTFRNISFVYGQRIFPAPRNAWLTGSYTRPNFTIDDIWNDNRHKRSQIPYDASDDANPTTNSQECARPRQSMWPLDAPEDFTTLTSPSGSGEYQEVGNRFDRYYGGNNICPGISYNFLVPTGFDATSTPVFGDTVLFEPKVWDDEEATCVQYSIPHQTYEQYARYIKLQGKDYSLIPEFRMSKHVETYRNEFVPDASLTMDTDFTNIFEVTGSAFKSGDSSNTEFFNDLSIGEFLKYFQVVDSATEGTLLVDGTTLMKTQFGLQCSAIIKPLPYKNFYPAEYVVNELGTLFSSSVGPYVEKRPTWKGAWRTLLEPWQALMLNSIKSGIGVGTYILTGDNTSLDDGVALPDVAGAPGIKGPATVQTPMGSTHAVNSVNNILKDYVINHGRGSIFSCSIDKSAGQNFYNPQRIPFEGLYKPASYFTALTISGSKEQTGIMYDTGIASASLSASSAGTHVRNSLRWNGTRGPLYELAIDQFLAAAQNIFIDPDERPVFFSSPASAINTQNIKQGEALALTFTFNRTLLPDGTADTATFENYSSPWAFGTPVALSDELTGGSNKVYSASYAPHTPAYMYGTSSVTMCVTASYDNPTLASLVSEAEFTYERSLETPAYSKAAMGYWFAQQVSESFNMRSVVSRQIPGTTQVDDHWAISPKWEYPIFHFPCTPTQGASAASAIAYTGQNADQVVKTRGMWHQYGLACTGSQGVFVEIGTPEFVVSPQYGRLVNPKSLASAVGFEEGVRKSIGNVRKSLKISEAIVAIPFITGRDGRRKFYKLPSTSPAAQKIAVSLDTYVFPPNFDWVHHPVVSSISMYIFEYDITLNQKDLGDIAQNVLPKAFRDTTKKDVYELPAPKTITHQLHGLNLLNKSTRKFRQDLRWLVFKVKQRAPHNYTLRNMTGDFSLRNIPDNVRTEYTYNWPYDWLSIVELIKLEEFITWEGGDTSTAPCPELDPEALEETDLVHLARTPSGDVIDIHIPPVGLACVVKGTYIDTSAGPVLVEDINVGAKVLSHNFNTSEMGYFEVLGTVTNTVNGWCKIRTKEGFELGCSLDHPIMSNSAAFWELAASDASPGDHTWVLKDGELRDDVIESVEIFEGSAEVYNMEVDNVHTYISDGILSHNAAINPTRAPGMTSKLQSKGGGAANLAYLKQQMLQQQHSDSNLAMLHQSNGRSAQGVQLSSGASKLKMYRAVYDSNQVKNLTEKQKQAQDASRSQAAAQAQQALALLR